jgi:hypothetical protein
MLSQHRASLSLIELIAAWVGVPGFSITGLYIGYVLVKGKPSIVINESGLEVLGFPSLKWEEISSVYLFEYYNKKFLGVRLKDKNSFINKLSPFRRFFANLAKTREWPPVSIGQVMLSEPIEAVFSEVESRLSAP